MRRMGAAGHIGEQRNNYGTRSITAPLLPNTHFKRRAIKPAIAETQCEDRSYFSCRELKAKGSKAVERLAISIRTDIRAELLSRDHNQRLAPCPLAVAKSGIASRPPHGLPATNRDTQII